MRSCNDQIHEMLKDFTLPPLIPCSWAMNSKNVSNDDWWPYWVSEWSRKCNFRAENEKILYVLFPPEGFMKCLLSPWNYLRCDTHLFKLIQFQFLYPSGFLTWRPWVYWSMNKFQRFMKFLHFYVIYWREDSEIANNCSRSSLNDTVRDK